MDMFLRSRQPKAVLHTTVLLSVFLLLTGISESGWRLLQRLKLVATKETIAAYIRQYRKSLELNNSFLVFGFDNCDFKKHVTNVRSDHRTEMLHIVTRYLIRFTSQI